MLSIHERRRVELLRAGLGGGWRAERAARLVEEALADAKEMAEAAPALRAKGVFTTYPIALDGGDRVLLISVKVIEGAGEEAGEELKRIMEEVCRRHKCEYAVVEERHPWLNWLEINAYLLLYGSISRP